MWHVVPPPHPQKERKTYYAWVMSSSSSSTRSAVMPLTQWSLATALVNILRRYEGLRTISLSKYRCLIFDMPNLFFTCQLEELRSNYLQKNKRKETKSLRVRYVLNTIIGWPTPIYQSFSQCNQSSPTINLISKLKFGALPNPTSRNHKPLRHSFAGFKTCVGVVLGVPLGDWC